MVLSKRVRIVGFKSAFALFLLLSGNSAFAAVQAKEGVYQTKGWLVWDKSKQIATFTMNPMSRSAFQVRLQNRSELSKALGVERKIAMAEVVYRLTRQTGPKSGDGIFEKIIATDLKKVPTYDSNLKEQK